MINIHYALQTCDKKSYQNNKRFCSDDRTEISKICISSFVQSVRNCALNVKGAYHFITIFVDDCTVELNEFLAELPKKYNQPNLVINLKQLDNKDGIRGSIEECYKWLMLNGKDLVYQVQDDYLFTPDCIETCIDMYFQMQNEVKTHAVISPYNDPNNWLTSYRNKVTPRVVIMGKKGYWIQYYDCSCSFLTSHNQFKQHWDLYELFFEKIQYRKNDDLENKSLNYMFTQRGVLGLIPVNSLAYHMQSELEKDPHTDWRPLWNSIKL